MQSRNKVIFHQKKSPCGHAEPQPSHFQQKKTYFFQNRCINLLYISYIYPFWGPIKGGGHPSLGIPISEQTRNAHIYIYIYIPSTVVLPLIGFSSGGHANFFFCEIGIYHTPFLYDWPSIIHLLV